jgi:photosystem II stability/assembly factor-like uncharacterized protein
MHKPAALYRSWRGLILPFLFLLASCHKNEVQLIVQKVNANTTYDLYRMSFVNDSVGYICGGTRYGIGVVVKTPDGGHSWLPADSVLPKGPYAMHFFNTMEGFIAGFDGYMTYTADGGNSYTQLPTFDYDPIQALTFRDRQQGIAALGVAYNAGKIYHTANGGTTWSLVYRDTMHSLMCAAYVGDSTAIVGGYGTILRSTDMGHSFKVVKEQGDFYQSVDFVDGQTGYMVGYQGEVLKTSDQGRTWASIRSSNGLWGSTDYLLSVDFINENTGYAVGESGLMIRTTNGGTSWQTVTPFTDSRLKSVHLFSAASGIVIGTSGAVYLFRE